ncbi:Na(+)-translocating NADH-quinone reductase subunit F [Sporomusa ovata DSM 2662]|uniref:Probable electron transfer protein n=1 Tax=Sporomusa ovata TaxID=2378 RepID=A0A0U1L223_9FIRM|nr:ASKHA domain-containing protein [Sporomusa ovata]EQB25169.1 putative ferredoxin-containing protein [Sporomusa ovata DSM 2662]CQR73727.1 probable electron transfer protein [Sporomusa ovata]
MPDIFIKNKSKRIQCKPDRNLLQLLLENGIFVDNPCNGKGSCGKCKIRLLQGKLPAVSETEKRLLKKEEIAAGVRLACLVVPEENIEIETLQKERTHEILTAGYMPDFRMNPGISKKKFQIEKPTLENQSAYEDSLGNALGREDLDWRLLQHLAMGDGEVTGVFSGEDLIGVETGDTTALTYGVAVDIGTTTVVTALIDLKTGDELASASMLNPQKKFGLDVLTRITYSIENPADGQKELQNAIVEGLNSLIEDMCSKSAVSMQNIYEISIAANCTMMHFLLGIDTAPIGRSPYAPVFVKSKNIMAKDIGLKGAPGARVYCLPSVSSYIGADIVAGAYVCQLEKSRGNLLFIDIGTNGEIVLAKNGRLMSCSCAAGPALEGMNISCGMRAAVGAIEDVAITAEGIKLKVIGDEAPIGLCGSGILAAVKELIRIGLVRKNGSFIKKEEMEETDYRYPMLRVDGKKREFVLRNGQEPLGITQGDIRQVQLAKGAILSGFHALLRQAELHMNQLDKVMIAGQFGAHLPVNSLVGTEILPEEVKDKIHYVGNSSKTGAYMALMSVEVKKEIEALAKQMDYIELGASEGYEKLFAKCLQFEKAQ